MSGVSITVDFSKVESPISLTSLSINEKECEDRNIKPFSALSPREVFTFPEDTRVNTIAISVILENHREIDSLGDYKTVCYTLKTSGEDRKVIYVCGDLKGISLNKIDGVIL